MRWSSLPVLALLGIVGCAAAPTSSPSSTVPEPVSAAVPVQESIVAPDVVPTDVPEAGACDAAPELDPRCPADVLAAAAMSWLDKTVAEFDGTSMRVIEYDRNALLEEAFADANFRRLVQIADAAPSDGVLDHAEARELEAAVLRVCDARIAVNRAP